MARSKYLRQISALRLELETWQNRYGFSAKTTSNSWLRERFLVREFQLGKAIAGLDQVADIVRELPRTSL